MREIDSYDDALAHVRRLKAQGAHSVKNYNQPRRDQRQQVVAAAAAREHAGRRRGRLAVQHGHDADPGRQLDARAQHPAGDASTRTCSSFLVADQDRLHADAGRHLWRPGRRSLLAPGNRRLEASAADPAHAADAIARADERAARSRRRKRISSTRTAPARRTSSPTRGVPVAIGAHGQQPGIGAHWEMWSFVRGG